MIDTQVEVVGSCDQDARKVDSKDTTRLTLTRSDPRRAAYTASFPLSIIASVDEMARVFIPAAEA